MLSFARVGLAAVVLLAACGDTEPTSPLTQQPTTTPAAVSSTTTSTATTSSSEAPSTTTAVATTTEASPPQIVIASRDGVLGWTEGDFETLVAGVPCRVAFHFGDGTVIYQESRDRYHDGEGTSVMVSRAGYEPEVLIAADDIAPTLWGVGEIDGGSVVVYERWPEPCGRDDSQPACEGRLFALDLAGGAQRDLDAFSAPGYALGPSEVRRGIVLTYNSGAETGELGGFLLHDLDGAAIDNPVCAGTVDCGQPMRMLGALSPGATELAFVLDEMRPGTETEYELVARRYGVVDLRTGEPVVTVELETTGRIAWLDFNGEQGLVSVSQGDADSVYFISKNGEVDRADLGGIATFSEG